jgi:hypothetical protein
MDVFIAVLASPKGALLDTTQGHTRVLELAIFAVQIRNRERAF